MSKVVAFCMQINVKKGTSKAKKELAEIGNRTKVGNNKDKIRTKTDYPKTEREKD